MGPLGAEAAETVSGPQLDAETRVAVQARRFHAQAVRAAAETPFYEDLLARLGIDPGRLAAATITDVPLTPMDVLRSDPHAFVSGRARSCVRVEEHGNDQRAHQRVPLPAWSCRRWPARSPPSASWPPA